MSYFKLQFQGYGLKQHDVQQWLGMAHEILDYRDNVGEEIHWTNSMFGGMPSVQISIAYGGNFIRDAFNVFFDIFSMPAGAALLSMLGFYVLAVCLGLSPWIGLVAGVAFGFTSYDIIILQAGHNTKAIAIALMAPALGSFLMAFRRNQILGVLLTTLFLMLQIGTNHLQVTYYFGILLVFVGGALFVEATKNGKVLEFLKTSGLLILGAIVAVLMNYGNVALTNDYAKYTIRGGNDVTVNPDGTDNTIASEGGLDKEYITQWSYGIGESFTLLSPNVKGGGSFAIGGSQFEDIVDEVDMNSQERNVVMNSPAYWGEQPFTSGPVYIGIIICYLALLGLVFLKGNLRWGLLLASILALMLSWGKNFMGLTDFFIDHVPGYNKFRTVTIILVIIQLALPLLGALFLQKLYDKRAEIKAEKRKFLITTGAFAVFLLIVTMMGLGDNYSSKGDLTRMEGMEANIFNQISNMDPATLQSQYGLDITNPQQVEQFVAQQAEPYQAGFDKVKEVRAEIFKSSMLRSFLFVLLAGGLLALFYYTEIKSDYLLLGLAVLVLMDLVPVANNYLGNQEQGSGYKYWEEKGKTDFPVASTNANTTILEQELSENPGLKSKIDKARSLGNQAALDRDLSGEAKQRVVDSYVFSALNRNTNYRVFDFGGGFSSSEASYFHKSLGGYHGAKLRNIQNLFEFHLSKSNNRVYDMMNVKYFIQNGEQGPVARRNPTALGNAWFVERVVPVASPNEEILSLGSQFTVKNVGTGILLVNGETKADAKVYGSETIQYKNGNDTLEVGLSNGMQVGMEALFVSDVNGRTNLIPAQVKSMDTTASFNKMVSITLTDDFEPNKEAFMLESELGAKSPKKYTAEGSIKMTQYNPDHMKYLSESKAPQMAIFSEVFYPEGWKAYIDNKEVPIKKADYLLRAIEVPAGKHKIEFVFDLPKLKMATAMNYALSILLLVCFGLYFWKRKGKKGAEK